MYSTTMCFLVLLCLLLSIVFARHMFAHLHFVKITKPITGVLSIMLEHTLETWNAERSSPPTDSGLRNGCNLFFKVVGCSSNIHLIFCALTHLCCALTHLCCALTHLCCALTIGMLSYNMLKNPPECAPAGKIHRSVHLLEHISITNDEKAMLWLVKNIAGVWWILL